MLSTVALCSGRRPGILSAAASPSRTVARPLLRSSAGTNGHDNHSSRLGGFSALQNSCIGNGARYCSYRPSARMHDGSSLRGAINRGTSTSQLLQMPRAMKPRPSARPSSTSSSDSGAQPPEPKPPPKKPRKVTTVSLAAKRRRGEKITMVTAYDYPSAVHVDRAGIDVVLVGDSCAMVELGFETTQPITLDQMIHHCQAVKRGAPTRPLLVGDMPFGSYEYEDADVALRNAYRMVKEGGMDAVKFEGGSESRAKIVRHVVEGGVAVLGHIGLLPQSISVIGGFRAQGRTAARARSLIDEALRLQDAGAFAVVLECIPANVASAITDALEIPTIGIGAGGGTSGQVLVFHDLLGMLSHPHHDEFVPKFCKKYARVGLHINDGLAQFKREVEEGAFPGEEYSPYKMSEDEEALFGELTLKDGPGRRESEGVGAAAETDASEQLNLYGNHSGDEDAK